MEFSDKKLNIFQRGILQKCIAFLAYLICASIAAFSIDLINKQWFISVAKRYYTNGQLPEEALKLFSFIMEFRVDTNIFNLAFLISVCVFICFKFVRFIAQLDLLRPVTLDKVIEFRKTMENIEIFKPEERIDFIIKSKIPLYIAYDPIISTEKEHVKAQFYACSKYDYFISANTINKYTVMQLLCIE